MPLVCEDNLMRPTDLASILLQIVQHFVAHPESVEVTVSDNPGARGDSVVELLVRGSPLDQGRLIGQAGRNVMAFQTIMNEVGKRNDTRVFVQILEPRTGGGSQSVGFVPIDDAKRDDKVKALLTTLSANVFGPDATVTKQVARNSGHETTEFVVHLRHPINPNLEASISRIFSGIGKNLGRLLAVRLYQHEGDTV